MSEISVIHIAVAVVAALAGIVLGWVFRGGRAGQEKSAINAGWQEQLEAKETEHKRLADQNKALMEQVSQLQASRKDSQMRTEELAATLKESLQRRDELQREIKDIRSNLEASVAEKAKTQSNVASSNAVEDGTASKLADRDEIIAKLSLELENWQNRVPPLIERFRERNAEAAHLEAELAEARERIEELESQSVETEDALPGDGIDPTQTRVEPVSNPEMLTDGLDASNEPIGHESAGDSEVATVNPLRDDLQLIKGVGPAIEKTLNEMGIFRYNQIAEMSAYDIDRVARRLKGLHTRIYREDWMGQARDLHNDKVGR